MACIFEHWPGFKEGLREGRHSVSKRKYKSQKQENVERKKEIMRMRRLHQCPETKFYKRGVKGLSFYKNPLCSAQPEDRGDDFRLEILSGGGGGLGRLLRRGIKNAQP